jgi:tripartite-type tricarboxylate transporter receptor subunit TctC
MQMQPMRRSVLLAGVAALAPVAWAQQSTWPTKPVTLLVGFPPGVLLAGLQSALGQAVIIDNKAGVNGNIAAAEALKAPPDGQKLFVGNGSMTITPHVYSKLGIIDPRQLTPIGVLLQSSLVLAVPASSPIRTYAQFVEAARAKAKAGKGMDYGTGGAGSLVHVTTELLRERIGGPAMNHVPYKGSSPAMIDLMAGRLDMMFDATSVVVPFIKEGKLRPILVTGTKREALFPDVPTATEAGVKDFVIISFIGLYGPPGLPADIVAKANSAMNTALKDPAVVKGITDRGDEPGGGTPDALGNLTRTHYKMWGDVVKANNIQAE